MKRSQLCALLTALLCGQACAYVDTPIISPASPSPATTVIAQITRGVCDALIIPPHPVVVTTGSIVELRVGWIGHTPSSLCTFGDVTTAYELGNFAPGNYQLRVIGLPSPGGPGPTQLASTTFSVSGVAAAQSIPATNWHTLLLLALLMASIGIGVVKTREY